MINESRGCAYPRGDWQEEIDRQSPAAIAARSSTNTPSHAKELKKPSQKMSIADYKTLKQTGVKPSPRVPATDAGTLGGTNGVGGMSMDRVPSIEGGLNGDSKHNDLGASSNLVASEEEAVKDTER